MPHNLPEALDVGLDLHIPEPIYLVEVGLDTPLYWTTSAQLEWNSITWLPVAMKVLSLNESQARLELRNDNNTGSSLVLNNKLRDKEFRIYLYYNGDAYLKFRGFGSDAQVGKMAVAIDIGLDRSRNTRVPRGRVAAPKFTHLPKLGEVIRWGEDHLKVTF